VVIGTHEACEREGIDQESINLPGRVPDLIHRIRSQNERTVVCLNCGSPKSLTPWIDEVKAVLVSWFGGQEAASALASVLIDGASAWGPCGRLPTTWPRSLMDCPAGIPPGAQYPGENGRVFYSEGTFVGYRWFNSRSLKPLFPFGHGLTYTNFMLHDLHVSPGTKISPDQNVTVKVRVKNVGIKRGKEVVQIYVGRKAHAGAEATTRELAAFCKVALEPGGSQTVSLLLPASKFHSTTCIGQQVARAPTELDIFVGFSCNNLPLSQTLRVL